MKTITKITSGAIGILTILSIVLGANLMGQENVYVCEFRQIAMVCDKLSKPNVNEVSTRCYYFDEEQDKSTYKICTDGWIKFEETKELPTSIYNLTDFVCKEGKFIRECVSEDGIVILRVKTE